MRLLGPLGGRVCARAPWFAFPLHTIPFVVLLLLYDGCQAFTGVNDEGKRLYDEMKNKHAYRYIIYRLGTDIVVHSCLSRFPIPMRHILI